ncbi:hypothetical protein Tco_0537050 [Tanacetum coccineum]
MRIKMGNDNGKREMGMTMRRESVNGKPIMGIREEWDDNGKIQWSIWKCVIIGTWNGNDQWKLATVRRKYQEKYANLVALLDSAFLPGGDSSQENQSELMLCIRFVMERRELS